MLFISAMAVMMMTTGIVFGASMTGESEATTIPYTIDFTGDRVDCTVGLTSTRAFIASINKSTTSRYVFYQIREYEYDVGWTDNYDSVGKTLAVSEPYTFYLTRNSRIDGYYHYYMICKDNQYTPAIYDTLSYNIIQE